jgi:hypothetical protein
MAKTKQILARILDEAGSPGLLEALTERLAPRDLATLLLHVMEARAADVGPAEAFALVTAGRARDGCAFEVEALAEHLRVHLRLLASLADLGFRLADVAVEVADTEVSERVLARLGVDRAALRETVRAYRPGSEQAALARLGAPLPGPVADPARELGDLLAGAPAALIERLERVREVVLSPLAREFADVKVSFVPTRAQALGFYRGLCLRVGATDPAGVPLPLGDGGFTTWTQALLSDQRERFLTSGIGLELLAARFRAR